MFAFLAQSGWSGLFSFLSPPRISPFFFRTFDGQLPAPKYYLMFKTGLVVPSG